MINNKKGTVHFPYFKRSDAGNNINSLTANKHKYQLINIAKNNVTIIEIYLHFFPNIFINKPLKSKIITKDKISRFFLLFMRIVALRNLIGLQKSLSGSITSFIKDFMNSKSTNEKEEEKHLLKFLKDEINDIYEKDYAQLIQKNSKSYTQSAINIEKKINEQLSIFYSKLESSIYLEEMKSDQFLPNKFDDKGLIRFIKNNFRCICNILVFRSSYKTQIWQQFDHINKVQWPQMKIIMIRKTAILPDLSNINDIYMPKYTNEKQPVLMSLQTYLKLIHRQRSLEILPEINKQILNYCLQYNKNTNRFYPNLSIRDIYFDQKKLQQVFSFNSLLLGAIGLKGDTKNFQLRLATEPTPNDLIFQECYFQAEDKFKPLINRKYFCPQPKPSAYEDNDNRLQAKEKDKDELTLLEEIHVLRLINIFYFVIRGTHFSIDYYNGKFEKLEKNKKPRPFYREQYKDSLKKIYNQILSNKLSLSEIIPLPQSFEQKYYQNEKEPEFKVGFAKLKNHFQLQINEDSLIENLKLYKLKHSFFERNELIKQIERLMFHEFKKLANTKKYFLAFCIYAFEEAYFRKQTGEYLSKMYKETNKSNRSCFLSEFKSLMFNTSLKKQADRRKKKKEESYKKLHDYSKKDPKDPKSVFLKNNSLQFNSIIRIEGQLKKIRVLNILQRIFLDHSKTIQEYEEELSLNSQHFQQNQFIDKVKFTLNSVVKEEKIKDVQNKIKIILQIQQLFEGEVQNRLNQILKEINQKLKPFIVQEIKKDLGIGKGKGRIREVHQLPENWKQKDEIWQRACTYWNTRLIVLIEVYFLLKQEDYMTYMRLKPMIEERQPLNKEQSISMKIEQLKLDNVLKILLSKRILR